MLIYIIGKNCFMFIEKSSTTSWIQSCNSIISMQQFVGIWDPPVDARDDIKIKLLSIQIHNFSAFFCVHLKLFIVGNVLLVNDWAGRNFNGKLEWSSRDDGMDGEKNAFNHEYRISISEGEFACAYLFGVWIIFSHFHFIHWKEVFVPPVNCETRMNGNFSRLSN